MSEIVSWTGPAESCSEPFALAVRWPLAFCSDWTAISRAFFDSSRRRFDDWRTLARVVSINESTTGMLRTAENSVAVRSTRCNTSVPHSRSCVVNSASTAWSTWTLTCCCWAPIVWSQTPACCCIVGLNGPLIFPETSARRPFMISEETKLFETCRLPSATSFKPHSTKKRSMFLRFNSEIFAGPAIDFEFSPNTEFATDSKPSAKCSTIDRCNNFLR